MPLSAEEIKALLLKPEKKSRKKKGIDTNVRDVATWFKLAPQAISEDTTSHRCDNPNCIDPRPPTITSTGKEIKVQATILIGDKQICRRCFLAGWLLENPEQTKLPT